MIFRLLHGGIWGNFKLLFKKKITETFSFSIPKSPSAESVESIEFCEIYHDASAKVPELQGFELFINFCNDT